jgi:hypothetical protein
VPQLVKQKFVLLLEWHILIDIDFETLWLPLPCIARVFVEALHQVDRHLVNRHRYPTNEGALQ